MSRKKSPVHSNVETNDVQFPIYQRIVDFKDGYQNVTSQMIAAENHIDYISKVECSRLNSSVKHSNQFFADHGCYIMFHPANDGLPTRPIEWYGMFDGIPKKIMDNQASFKCIANISDILLQIVRLYAKYIDENVFICSFGFALRLDDKVTPDYVGNASLALTDYAIQNHRVKTEQILQARQYCVNEFLDRFIGWNFGVPVKSNPQLEKELLEFNDLAISKGLRKVTLPGFEVWCSKDVQHYYLRMG